MNDQNRARAKEWLNTLEPNGVRAQLIPVERLDDLKSRFKDSLLSFGTDPGLYDRYLKGFRFRCSSSSYCSVKSILLTASAQPMMQADFTVDGRTVAVLIPPTYCYATDAKIIRLCKQNLEPHGFRLSKVNLPVKLLAVSSGLATYGRNNITYIPGMGSFFRLRAFGSNLPAIDPQWSSPKMLSNCSGCTACLKSCPTGAIQTERFMIRAEKCLTYLNEIPDEFPAWLNSDAHNCLIGCMRCQLLCPENRQFRRWIVRNVTFSAEETAEILDHGDSKILSQTTRRKLRQINLLKEIKILPRNLRAILFKKTEP